MQAKGLQHAPDSKLRQGCPSCSAVGIVAVWAADDHSQACVEKANYYTGQLIYPQMSSLCKVQCVKSIVSMECLSTLNPEVSSFELQSAYSRYCDVGEWYLCELCQ